MQEKRKKIQIILSIILGLIIILLGTIYLKKNIYENNINQFKNKTYYEVNLKPSIFFDQKKENYNYYIANSIKSIDIYFNYYIKNKTKENYSYDIIATLKSYADNGTKLIWFKDFNLKNIDNIKQEEINIKENYSFEYQYYVNYVKSLQEYYNIKTENYLDVKLNIKINDKANYYVLLTIPLNGNIVEITMKEDNVLLENNNSDINKILIVIIIAPAIIVLGNKILSNKDNEKTILKKYQDQIIVIQNEPNINGNNIIYLSNLKDLINIAINNNLNIFNYHNNYYSSIDNTYYIYILKKDIKD